MDAGVEVDGEYLNLGEFLVQSDWRGRERDCCNAIKQLGKTKQWTMAKEVLDKMETRGAVPNIFCFNAAVSALAHSRQWRPALEILKSMENRSGVKPDVITFSAAITACEKGSQWELALQLMDQMQDDGLHPNVITVSSAISACAKGSQWEKALELIGMMEEKRLTPNVITYSAVLSACEKAGQWEMALQVLDRMERNTIEPNGVCLCSVLLALDSAQQTDQKVEKLFLPVYQQVRTELVGLVIKGSDHPVNTLQEIGCPGLGRIFTRRFFQWGRMLQYFTNAREKLAQYLSESEVPLARLSGTMPSFVQWELTGYNQGEEVKYEGESVAHPGKVNSEWGSELESQISPVFVYHDRSHHSERQACLMVLNSVKDCFNSAKPLKGWVKIYASHTPCISCTAAICQLRHVLGPDVSTTVDFETWEVTRSLAIDYDEDKLLKEDKEKEEKERRELSIDPMLDQQRTYFEEKRLKNKIQDMAAWREKMNAMREALVQEQARFRQRVQQLDDMEAGKTSLVGKVKSWGADNGFGFIVTMEVDQDVFGMKNHLQGTKQSLRPGDWVTFDLHYDKGRPQARRICAITAEEAEIKMEERKKAQEEEDARKAEEAEEKALAEAELENSDGVPPPPDESAQDALERLAKEHARREAREARGRGAIDDGAYFGPTAKREEAPMTFGQQMKIGVPTMPSPTFEESPTQLWETTTKSTTDMMKNMRQQFVPQPPPMQQPPFYGGKMGSPPMQQPQMGSMPMQPPQMGSMPMQPNQMGAVGKGYGGGYPGYGYGPGKPGPPSFGKQGGPSPAPWDGGKGMPGKGMPGFGGKGPSYDYGGYGQGPTNPADGWGQSSGYGGQSFSSSPSYGYGQSDWTQEDWNPRR